MGIKGGVAQKIRSVYLLSVPSMVGPGVCVPKLPVKYGVRHEADEIHVRPAKADLSKLALGPGVTASVCRGQLLVLGRLKNTAELRSV